MIKNMMVMDISSISNNLHINLMVAMMEVVPETTTLEGIITTILVEMMILIKVVVAIEMVATSIDENIFCLCDCYIFPILIVSSYVFFKKRNTETY